MEEAEGTAGDELARRERRAAESILENESLTADLDDKVATVLLDWGLACATEIARSTASLDPAQATIATSERLRATRRLMRRVNRQSMDMSGSAVLLAQIIEQAAVIYGEGFTPPDRGQQQTFLSLLGELADDPEGFISALRTFVEGSGDGPVADRKAGQTGDSVYNAWVKSNEQRLTEEHMISTDGGFYLGRMVDPQSGKTTEDPLLYDPDDLNTHAVVVGMTGSGKTGLCIDLLEEAALNQIPAILIDPKGDITNALLHFPELLPADFEPWVNADEARREGKTIQEAAADTATLWRNGLADWDISPARIGQLRDSAHFAIYTPGADAGLPVNILASLKAPEIPWESNRQVLREKISDTITALLGLIGLKDIDPVRSREHILLSHIFEHAWSRGQDLTLTELILQTQNPPFEKLGVFDVATLFPDRERLELAMDLNNILAAPAFQTWIEGEPLDIGNLLYHPDGKPRHSVFYIAHLDEAQRTFFVALLYSAVESWMRTQPGSTALRALVYFDEIFGYLPPVGNPPSKEPMLRMLKQARAFGVGLVLATQNPVDVDYKALSNAGTWFVGKLGTEQDKNRLLDGLATAIGTGMDRREYDDLISRLGKRVFLMRNVHDKRPSLFQTRWAMNYLAGPVTRSQIGALNELAGATAVSFAAPVVSAPASAPAAAPAAAPAPAAVRQTTPAIGSETRPQVPTRVHEYVLPNNLSLEEAAALSGRDLPPNAKSLGLLYRPVLLAQANIRLTRRKFDLDTEIQRAVLVEEPDRRGNVRWDDHPTPAMDERRLGRTPGPDARFGDLVPPLSDGGAVKAMERDFLDWAYRSTEVRVRAHEKLQVYAGPDVSEERFARMCEEAAAEKREAEIEKVTASYDRKIDRLETRLLRERRELKEDAADLSARKQEEMGTHLDTLLGFLGGRRRSVSSSMSKRRMTQKARMDVEESKEAIAEFESQMETLSEERAEAIAEIEGKWAEIVADVTEITVNPYKKDVNVTLFGVAWFPYHVVDTDGHALELPGFSAE